MAGSAAGHGEKFVISVKQNGATVKLPRIRQFAIFPAMNRKSLLLFLAIAIATTVFAFGDASARQGRREPQSQPELDVSKLNPETVRKSFLGTWNDNLGRFWFTIDDIAGNQVRTARFHLAHLKNGHIDGNRLTLVSRSCVPLVGCYDYNIDGRLITLSRMDMHATDETGDTVHFILVRK
jgi:hypothetical protein